MVRLRIMWRERDGAPRVVETTCRLPHTAARLHTLGAAWRYQADTRLQPEDKGRNEALSATWGLHARAMLWAGGG